MKSVIIFVTERGITMNSIKRILIEVTFGFVIAVLLPVAKAADTTWNMVGDDNWATVFNFPEPVQIGNLVLAPGNYMIQRYPSIYSSRVVMVYNLDQSRWEGLVVGEAARRTGTNNDSVLYREKQGEGEPDMVQYWFHKDWNDGIAFRPSHVNMTQTAAKRSKTIATIASSGK
jgi:hypothetical protein